MELEPDDIVVDVGAFVGEFCIPASQIGEHVIALEPDGETIECLKRNVLPYENIEVHRQLASNEQNSIPFKQADDPTESSFLDVDGGDYIEEMVSAVRLDEFLQELGHSEIDFLKIDGEGAEPEILEGVENVDVAKIAVDAGDEQYGESTADAVTSLLTERGYETRYDPPMVFGRKC